MSTNIYILKLEGGRYYVGKSENVVKRYQEHMNGSGSAWTKKYKPIGIDKVYENVSPFDEDKNLKIYMSKYGIDKVRGGAYVLEELPEFQVDALKSELWGSADKCTICGRAGHWAKNCYAKKDITGTEIVNTSESEDEIIICGDCNKEFLSESAFDNHYCRPVKIHTNSSKKTGVCYRCGRPGHYSPDCYAQKHKDGYDLD